MKSIALAALTLAITTGCTNTVWVREQYIDRNGDEAYRQVGGIPFYTKKQKHTQTTSYKQSWLVATLTVERVLNSKTDDGVKTTPIDAQQFTRRLTLERINELDAIKRKIVNSQHNRAADAQAIINAFMDVRDDSDTDKIQEVLIGDSVSTEFVVDTSKAYYLNAPLPWFGSNNMTQKLSADGTLTEVSVNADTKLAEGLTSLIPFKEYLTARYVDQPPAPTKALELRALGADSGDDIVFKISLALEEKGYVYRFVRELSGSWSKPIEFDLIKGGYTREPLAADKSADKPAEKPKKPGIEFSGQVSVPETWTK